MAEVDGIIFASPVYLGTVTRQMKTFLDRCLPLGHRPQLMGKYGLAVAVSAGIQDVETRDYLQNALTSFGVSVVGGICGIAVGPGFLDEEEIVTEHATRLGNQLVTAIREKHQYPETGELRVHEPFSETLLFDIKAFFRRTMNIGTKRVG
jgi:multimeric flavodoxin WrbA